MLKLSKKDNNFVVLGRIKLYMDKNEIEGADEFVKDALGKNTAAIIECAREYVEFEVE